MNQLFLRVFLCVQAFFYLRSVQIRHQFNSRGQVFVLHDSDEIVQLGQCHGDLLRRERDGGRVLEDPEDVVSLVDDDLQTKKHNLFIFKVFCFSE